MLQVLTPVAPADAAPLREEMLRQYRLLRNEVPIRFATALLAFGLCGLFLDWNVIALCAAANLLAEATNLTLLKQPDTADRADRYRLLLGSEFLIQLAYVIPPALIWHSDIAYAQPFAVGMTLARLLHLVSLVAVHLPLGLAGIAAISLVALTTSTLYWLDPFDGVGLLVGTVCTASVLAYCVLAIVAGNRLHRETAAGRCEAQAANAAKGRFLAMMSHELRTPLNAILGMGHAERHRAQDALAKERLGVLIASAEGLGVILNDILDMSAMQQGRLPIRPEPADLRREIAMVMGLFRPGADQTGLQMRLELSPELPEYALIDAQRLRQCLSNLLSNALKHTQAGEIAVQVRVERSGDGQPLLRIEVTDSGTGIAPDRSEAIFEPFSRGQGSTLGSGLGLSISRALARQMGGDLCLLAPLHGLPGARFVLTVGLQALPPPAGARPQTASATATLAGRVVLAVDDVATNRLVALTYLRMLGAQAYEAASGEAALRLLAEQRVDLVLLDMNMPQMDGLDTFRRLRAMSGHAASVPVVAMTADVLPEHRQKYLAAGLDGYLTKPMSPDQIAAELLRVLADRPLAREPADATA